ncbi:YiiX/YebB-like N1pC/P60 family cysteine hydrolase [Polaribacter marinaquae]|uniref:YiiX/YebB-like N1pC/P60 family cysteine hydrolase n=1 Tax=Polaribacter marinaquae TaxID=1642819 RepID=A0ABZ2TMW2_9FLAO
MMHKILKSSIGTLLTILVLLSCNTDKKKKEFKLQQGDLLFQNTGTDEIDNAIKDVTATSKAKNYSHVGIAMQEDDKWFVVEAIPKIGISKTPITEFLNRNKNKQDKSQTTVARLDSMYQPYISKAINYGIERIGIPYDAVFLWDDTSYYCSELVYKMFSSQNLSKEDLPFLTHPMTFNDKSGKPMASWVKYYEVRNQPIPEGIEGTNPNLMASSSKITFVHDYEKE